MNWKELDDGQLLTVDEVANWLRLEKSHVYQLARIGVLPRAIVGARYVRIPAGAVRAYIMVNLAEPQELRSAPRRRSGVRRPGARRHLRMVHNAER